MVRGALELETRRRLHTLILTHPGLHLRGLARSMRIDVRTAVYHLQHLEKHGLVTSLEEGGFRRFFPRTAERKAEIVDARDKPLLAILRKRVPLAITLVLLTRDAASHGDLAREAGVAPATLSYHLDRMERAAIITRDRATSVLREPERIASLIYAYRPTSELLDRFNDLWEDFALWTGRAQ